MTHICFCIVASNYLCRVARFCCCTVHVRSHMKKRKKSKLARPGDVLPIAQVTDASSIGFDKLHLHPHDGLILLDPHGSHGLSLSM